MKTINLEETKHFMCFTCPIKLKDNYCPYDDYCSIIDRLERMPSSGAEYVIRCKECTHWRKDVAGCTEFVGYCDIAKWMIGQNGYCLYGETNDLPYEER